MQAGHAGRLGEELIEGAMQQAPQPGRQSMGGGSVIERRTFSPIFNQALSPDLKNYAVPAPPPEGVPCPPPRAAAGPCRLANRPPTHRRPRAGHALWANDALSRELGRPSTSNWRISSVPGRSSCGAPPTRSTACCAGVGRPRRHRGLRRQPRPGRGLRRRGAGLAATVVMPVNAPLTKIESCRSLGAEVVPAGKPRGGAGGGANPGDRRGAPCIHPYDDWEIIAGQAGGTWKSSKPCPPWPRLSFPWAAAALAGIALAVKRQRPDVRIVGVQADAVPPAPLP